MNHLVRHSTNPPRSRLGGVKFEGKDEQEDEDETEGGLVAPKPKAKAEDNL